MGGIGRTLVIVGIVLVALGAIFWAVDKFPHLPIGRLPGDIHVRRGNFSFYFPITTSIAVSVLLSLILWLISRSR
ncbi:MAG: DUF2905 domain-containing protein [bacterium]